MIIYKTTNLVNGKIYIGKDSKNNPNYLGSGVVLRKAIEKHGIENFIKEILEICENQSDLNDREKYWIKHFKSNDRIFGYNLTSGGDGGDTFTYNTEDKKREMSAKISKQSTGRKHTKEAKTKISKARMAEGNGMFGKTPWNKGVPTSQETKNKISKALKGKSTGPKSQYVKDCISKAQSGKIKSQEHKDKISKSLTGRKVPRESVEKTALALRGRKQAILTCPHCLKEGGTTMYRWHFDKCKFRS